MRLLRPCLGVIGLAAFVCVAGQASMQAPDRYYMLIFAYQGTPAVPRTAHTFATFVRAATDDDGGHRVVATQTISWLPASLNVRVLRGLPERGSNLTLEETLDVARSMNARISLWGPYEIDKELYDRAERQVERLQSGAIAYKVLDGGLRPNAGTNCFHAVSDLDTDRGLLATGAAFGRSASALVARHLSRWVIDPDRRHRWLIESLGLKETDIDVQEN